MTKYIIMLLIGMLKSPWSSRYYVGLLDVRPQIKTFLRQLLLSRFLTKTRRVIKISTKSFPESTLNLIATVIFQLVSQVSTKKNLKKKILLRRLLLSRFVAKTLRVNKPAMKRFAQKICRSKTMLNCKSHSTSIKIYLNKEVRP